MHQTLMTNRTFDEIELGDTAALERTLKLEDIDLFAAVSGDYNPAHVDARFAESDVFGHVVAHGLWTAALVSALLGTKLPGPGTIYLGQDLRFRRPVFPGDTITAKVTATDKRADKRIITFDSLCTNQHGEDVLTGTATVIAPDQRVEWPHQQRPDLSLHRHDRFDAIVAQARNAPAMRTAVVHPCSPEAIAAAVEIRDQGLFEPLLVGPIAKIRAAAEKAGVALDGFAIEDAEHSHAAAERAVALAAAGTVATLMKGSLHTDELLAAVLASGSGLRTDRRISHVYVMDVPTYPKLLVVTDAAINIAPDLEQKRHICQNAIDLLLMLGNKEPKVAVLAAVETVNPKMQATLDAAALTAMASRGQITGARVDGPLAFDNAISLEAAKTKSIVSPVAGDADILLVPDLEAGNMLAKQLLYLADADAAGLVLGARVPIILTSRADSLKTRVASAALAKLMAAHRKKEG